jgi:hypothetical protein
MRRNVLRGVVPVGDGLNWRSSSSKKARLVSTEPASFVASAAVTPAMPAFGSTLPTTAGEWMEVRVPLEDFIPTAFGRRVQGMGPVEPNEINGLGFMLSDKKPGKFQMQVEWVKVGRKEP